MGKIISVVGNLGAGKTTLVKLLCKQGGFTPYWENPEEHPFQAAFTEDMKRWALANQLDFLLFRCKQEYLASSRSGVAIMDGGFDQDFQVFTKNLHNRDLLNDSEFRICQDFYNYVRSVLPPPDLLIRVIVDRATLLERRSLRGRKTVDEKFSQEVFNDLEKLLDDWLESEISTPVIRLSFERDIDYYANRITELIEQIKSIMYPA
jgi:deoxyadenosine/deoxycytidine kinase